MRGRCLGAIVDQLILGRFLADLGRFLINFGNIGPKRKCEENHAKICDFEARGSQNQPKWCPGALQKGTLEISHEKGQPGTKNCEAFWRHLGDFGCHLVSSWAPRGSQNRAFWHQDTPK